MTNEFPPDTSTAPPVGSVNFYDNCRPNLLAGKYKISVSQEVAFTDNTTAPLPDAQEQKFKITGPRFQLNPTDIHAAYPPPNIEGEFAGRLAQIVLRRRTLPWERTVDPDDEDHLSPWLAMLLFKEGEIKVLEPPLTVRDCVVAEDGENIDPPKLDLSTQELDQACMGIQVPLDTFKRVAPLKEELDMLVHVRQVNTRDKELLGMDKDGWFAVVVGNRVIHGGTKYHACLVSLEGHLHHLPPSHEIAPMTSVLSPSLADVEAIEHAGTATLPPEIDITDIQPIAGETETSPEDEPDIDAVEPVEFQYQPGINYVADLGWVLAPQTKAIRLITLAHWEFKVKPGGEDFQCIMEKLPERGGIAMLGMTPKDAVLEGSPPSSAYNVALESGHVPLQYRTRAGEQAVAWYRGPMVPVGVERESTGPYHCADQARRIDPLTGLENLGYAAAFEIGKLVALSDPNFALELLRWRRGGHRRVAQMLVNHRLLERLDDVLADIDPDKLIEAHNVIETIIDEVIVQVELDMVMPVVDPTGTDPFIEDLPGLDQPQVESAMGFEHGALQELFRGSLVSSEDLSQLGILDSIEASSGITGLEAVDAGQFEHLRSTRREAMDRRGGML